MYPNLFTRGQPASWKLTLGQWNVFNFQTIVTPRIWETYIRSIECIQTIIMRGQTALGEAYIKSMECIQTIVTRGQLVNGKPTFGPGNSKREFYARLRPNRNRIYWLQ